MAGVKQPPRVLESERAALGAALKRDDREAVELLTSELKPEDFTDDDCRKIFQAIVALSDAGLSVNPVTVSERTGVGMGTIDDISGAGLGLSSLQVRTLVSEIRRVSQVRSVFLTCQAVTKSAGKESNLDDIMTLLEKGLYGLSADGKDAVDGSEIAQKAFETFMERYNSPDIAEVSTGLSVLDRAIIGLRPGKMFVIAGRPSMGKTALADSIRRAVVDQGFGAIQFSLEMSAEELLERELAYRSQVNLRKILSGKEVSPEELERVRSGAGAVMGGRWWIDDSSYSIGGIRRRSRIIAQRMARTGIKLGVIVLDYIQLAGDNGDGREQSVAAISRGCKLMAKELGCTVIALSQLNRACEMREDRRPQMSDLRESGSIEQDADIVAFVYREHIYDSDFPPERAELIIRKHRSGPVGEIELHYNAKLCAFEDMKATPVPPVTPVTPKEPPQ